MYGVFGSVVESEKCLHAIFLLAELHLCVSIHSDSLSYELLSVANFIIRNT